MLGDEVTKFIKKQHQRNHQSTFHAVSRVNNSLKLPPQHCLSFSVEILAVHPHSKNENHLCRVRVGSRGHTVRRNIENVENDMWKASREQQGVRRLLSSSHPSRFLNSILSAVHWVRGGVPAKNNYFSIMLAYMAVIVSA